MANTPNEIRFAPHGRVSVATYGSGAVAPAQIGTIQVDGLPEVPEGFHELGFCTADGVEITPKIETQELEAWQSATPVMYSVKSASLQVKSTLMQVNSQNTSLYFGAEWKQNVGEGGTAIEGEYVLDLASSPDLSEIVLVIDWSDMSSDKDTQGKANRLVIPHAIVSDRDSIKLTRTDNESFGLTIDALDEAGSLGKFYTTQNMGPEAGSYMTDGEVAPGEQTQILGKNYDPKTAVKGSVK